MDLYYLLPPLIASGFAAILLVAVLSKGHRDSASRIFSFIIFVTFLWGIFIFLMRVSPDIEQALKWNKAAIVTGFATPVLCYHFSLIFSGMRDGRLLLPVAYFSLLLVIALSPTGFFVKEITEESYGYAPVLGHGLYLLAFGYIFLVLSFYYLIRAYRKSVEYEHKNRLLYIIFAFSIIVLGTVPEIFPSVYPTAIFGNIIFCLFASVAIFKHHLFDIRIAFRRGLSYLVLSGLTAVPFVGIILLISWALGVKQLPVWVYVILLILLALAVQPFWRRVQRLVDRFFYRGRYGHLTALERFSKECTRIIDIKDLCSNLVSVTPAAMGAPMAHLMMHDGDNNQFLLAASSTSTFEPDCKLDADSSIVRWFEHNDRPLRRSDIDSLSTLTAITAQEKNMLEHLNAGLLVPFRHGENLSGILILSPKLTEEPYGADDIATLMVLARHASIAIENAHLLSQYQQIAIMDDLTGLYNRRHFYEVLESESSRAKRYGSHFTLVIFDLDGFKEYNDKFGHISGDAVLVSLAQTLKSSLRKSDTCFRYGGDEFTSILPMTDAGKTKTVVERIRTRWLQNPESQYPILETPLGFSAGIAQFPAHADTADGLVFMADSALYQAKKVGGYTSMLASDIQSLSSEVLQIATPDQVSALAATVDAKDPYTYGHSKNVADIAKKIGGLIGLSSKEMADLYAVSLLHDIGKLSVPDSILTKPGKLTKEEWEIIKRHSVEGERIVSYIKALSALAHMIRHHHEWYNGAGYPDGLRGDTIPLGARIISIADAYDTMTSRRPYKDPVPPRDALKELKRCAGTQFDPELVASFCQAMENSLD